MIKRIRKSAGRKDVRELSSDDENQMEIRDSNEWNQAQPKKNMNRKRWLNLKLKPIDDCVGVLE